MAGLAVEIAEAGDELVLARGGAAGAQAGLDRGRAAVVELDAVSRPGRTSIIFSSSRTLTGGGEVVGVHQRLRAFATASETFGWQWPSVVT